MPSFDTSIKQFHGDTFGDVAPGSRQKILVMMSFSSLSIPIANKACAPSLNSVEIITGVFWLTNCLINSILSSLDLGLLCIALISNGCSLISRANAV